MEKLPIFEQNSASASTFLTSSLCSLERRFQFLENQKNIILAYLPKIRKRKNCQFLIKTLDPLEKSQFFDLLNLLLL